ncbi:hypothetical protein HFO91_33355 [Rhizobium leguminosarum]|uniref:hypothetical protein n=1 Tax=Rhizobium leguminosarum TaxID=384 RepID=UPI001C93B092|nr:hypothetical protein [Rhizobium leguminosarum]MBY5371573.1 hypothetical protein [Rhizobium leguminosarum]MBY5454443.1 hypothetical protein [Rhizobium leguminosarum]
MDKSVAFTSVDLTLPRSALRQQCQLQDPVSINLDQVLQATRMVARIQLPVPSTTELAQALPMIGEIEIAGLGLILDHIDVDGDVLDGPLPVGHLTLYMSRPE